MGVCDQLSSRDRDFLIRYQYSLLLRRQQIILSITLCLYGIGYNIT